MREEFILNRDVMADVEDADCAALRRLGGVRENRNVRGEVFS